MSQPQTPPQKKYIVSEGLMQAVLQYLATRPIMEASDMFHALRGCQELVDVKAPDSKPAEDSKPKKAPKTAKLDAPKAEEAQSE